MPEVLLQAKNLFCERDDRILFEGLDFSLEAGEVAQVIGPNGAGKTTLLRVLSGLYANYEGDLLWRGTNLLKVRQDFLSNILFIGHKAGVKLAMSPIENLRFMMGLHRLYKDDELMWALEQVGLRGFEIVPCSNLSAGQKRRVALARLYLSRARLWILDEAFTAIDLGGVAQLEGLIAEKARQGVTVILTTHHELKLSIPFKHIALGRRPRNTVVEAGAPLAGVAE